MAVINPPMWMQAGSYPARNDRLALTALMAYPGFAADEATPLRIRQGVKPSYQNYQLKVRPAPTPNMTVIVSAGFAYVDQHDTGGQGTYICVNDADVVLTVQPAGTAGQYRKDCVVASVYDGEYAGSVSEWRLEIIQGPYAASAGATVRGTLPPNSQILADISVGPSQTSVSAAHIGDVRNYTVGVGGILPVASNIAPTRMHPGQTLYLTDRDEFRYGRQDGTTRDMQPAWFSGWKPLANYGSFQNGSTANATNPPQVGDIIIGGFTERVFRGVINLTGVTAGGGHPFFTWNTGYRPGYERNFAAAGTGTGTYRVYLSIAGNWGLTDHNSGQTAIPIGQFRVTDPPGTL